jgi:hypothetical protein
MYDEDWHRYHYVLCNDECGCIIIACSYCDSIGHCFRFPETWIRCCVNMTSVGDHIRNHHTVFCSENCEELYELTMQLSV